MWGEERLISWIKGFKRCCLNNHLESEANLGLTDKRAIGIGIIESNRINKIL
jgi:hypothetical protein